MGERGAETEEGNVMKATITGTEIETIKNGKAFEVERGTEEEKEIEIGIMMTEAEIMGVIGTEVDTDIKDDSSNLF